MKSYSKAILSRVAQFGLLYLAVGLQIQGFMNLLSFLIWVLGVVYLMTLFLPQETWVEIYKKSKLSVIPDNLSNLLNLIYLGILVFSGYFLLGTVYSLAWFCMYTGLIRGQKGAEAEADS